MKKMFALVVLLVASVCALSIINCFYDAKPVVTVMSEQANSVATSSADYYTNDRQENPVGINAENQYDILAENHLYGHNDYGDYVPAETRYVNGFPTVDGLKTFSPYYESKPYVIPAPEEKAREDWNLHDFHKNGELFETVGNGEMHFYNEEDMEAYAQSLRDEFGAENVVEVEIDANGEIIGPVSSGSDSSVFDSVKDTVDDVNTKQDEIMNSAE